MSIKPDKLIKSMLGEDFFEKLKKSDIYKPHNSSATSVEELHIGMKIVPRAIMSFLVSNLSGMELGGNKDLELPFAPSYRLKITKHARDSFLGYIYIHGKKISEFKNRSIPGLGLVLMTSLELYDIEDLKEAREEEKQSFDVTKLQEMIDDRLRLHSLVASVVDQKMAQRDAVEILVKEKLAQALKEKEKAEIEVNVEAEAEVEYEDEEEHEEYGYEEEDEVEEELKPQPTKADKLRDFIAQSKKRQEEFEIEKRESIHCPDCGTGLYEGGKNLTLCICYGEDWNKDIKITKSESNIKMKFPKSMDSENIEMLLQTLRNINKD